MPTPAEPPAPEDLGAQSQAWASLLERLLRGLEHGSRQWPIGKRKDSVSRMLVMYRQDISRLRQRLEPLVASWEGDKGSSAALAGAAQPAAPAPAPAPGPALAAAPAPVQTAGSAPADQDPPVPAQERAAPADAPWQLPPNRWHAVVASLELTVRTALPAGDPRATEAGESLTALAERLRREGATPAMADEVELACRSVRRLLAHRHHLVDELGALCSNLTEGLVELSEDDSWARGQASAVRDRLGDEVSVRSVRAASEMLSEARARHQRVRQERDAARNALRDVIPRMLAELASLDGQTGDFEGKLSRHAQAIQSADTLEGLAGVVSAMVDETRAVQQVVGSARGRLEEESRKADQMQRRVEQLEGELKRLSDEVSTDALTRVANRRGLDQAFATECAKLQRNPGPLAVGLIDIDNFKKLNDTLGHAAGDVALKALAERVKQGLRPVDTVARFGGEEFVVLLPGTPVDEAQTVLTRLQRELTKSLFLHEKREIFVTFSAGVTALRTGEALQPALERADEALYEAKRTGKNRTCVG
jgi:diguanylate cyclase